MDTKKTNQKSLFAALEEMRNYITQLENEIKEKCDKESYQDAFRQFEEEFSNIVSLYSIAHSKKNNFILELEKAKQNIYFKYGGYIEYHQKKDKVDSL